MAITEAILVLGGIGACGAVALNRIAKRFHVDEDMRIGVIESMLPGANCGACGRKGCHDFAVQCVEAGNLDGLYCPSAGKEGMDKIAAFMGCTADDVAANVAVVRCAGSKETKTPLPAKFIGPRSCAIMNLTAGDYECANSCLGCGDCTEACKFGAIVINDGDAHPTVDPDRCTGCGACVTKCPRHIIELHQKGPKGRYVYVACSNCMKGAVTRKQCTVGCIGCGLCVKACNFGAITIVNNHAVIDGSKCKTCGKCVTVCPGKCIIKPPSPL